MSDIVVIGGGMMMHLLCFDQPNFKSDAFKKSGLSVTVIMPSEFVEFPFAGPILLKEPERAHEFISANKSNFTSPSFSTVYGVVTKVDPVAKLVHIGAKTVPYKVLIVATGRQLPILNSTPGQTLDERLAEIKMVSGKCKAAKTIAIVSAGAIALETAGCIRQLNPNARVCLISRDGYPLEKYHDLAYRKKALAALAAKKIEIVEGSVEGDYVAPVLEPGEIRLKDGILSYDVLIPGMYQKANTSFLKETGVINEQTGYIITQNNLQSIKHKEIFGVSNTEAFSPAKHQAVGSGMAQAALVVQNAMAFMKGGPLENFELEKLPMGNGNFTMPMYYNIGNGKGGLTIYNLETMNAMLPILKCCACMGFPFCPPCCCWCMAPECSKACVDVNEWTEHHAVHFNEFMLKKSWIPNTGWGYLSEQKPEQLTMVSSREGDRLLS